MTEAHEQDLIEVVDSNYHGISALAARLVEAVDDFDRDVESARLVREIVQHHTAMEEVLLPLIRKSLDNGDQIAHQQFQQHRQLEHELRTLEHADHSSAEFTAALATVRESWDRNGHYLEQKVLPHLRTRCEASELQRLASLALEAELRGPTRPRTIAIEEPLVNALISEAQGQIDMTFDALTNHAHEGSDELDARLESGRYDDLEALDRSAPRGGTNGNT